MNATFSELWTSIKSASSVVVLARSAIDLFRSWLSTQSRSQSLCRDEHCAEVIRGHVHTLESTAKTLTAIRQGENIALYQTHFKYRS